MWEHPTKKHPEGRYIISTSNKIIKNTVIPPEYKGRFPYFKFEFLSFMLASYPQGMVEQLVSLQEEYNYTITRLASYKKWMAGKLMVPRYSKMDTKWDDEVGQIIKYDPAGGSPEWNSPPAPPSILMNDLVRIRKDMEDISAVHDTSVGRTPGQAKSGIAIQSLNEQDNSQLLPTLIGIEEKLGFFCETVLDIMEAKYTEPRLLSITGEGLGAEIKTFLGHELRSNRRIKIKLGSAMPVSKSARQEFLMNLAMGEFITKQKAMELMEFGDLEGVYHNVDETAANQRIRKCLRVCNLCQWNGMTILSMLLLILKL